MSYLKSNKRGQKTEKKQDKSEGMVPAEGRESVFNFTGENDVTTISAQVIMEKLKTGCDFNFNSYRILQSTSNDEVNKSDAVIIISASILNRLGATAAAKQVLTESDDAALYYEKLGLEDKSTLSTFTTLLTIIAPELLKASEIAITSLLSQTSRKTTVTHSVTRLALALEGVTGAGIISQTDAELSSLLTNLMPRTSRVALAQQLLIDSDSDQITPQESISRQASRPVSATKVVQEEGAELKLTTGNLMKYAKGRQQRNAADFNTVFRPKTKPVESKGNKAQQGLGYVEDDSSSQEEILVRRPKRRNGKGKDKELKPESSTKKITKMIKDIELVATHGSLPSAGNGSDSDLLTI